MLSYKVRMYYILKKILPRRFQIALRSKVVLRKWDKLGRSWPLYDPSAQYPPNWSGWPDGKKFAFVLTHDVDTAKGLRRCLDLAGVEEELGFRSLFTIVGGDYEVSPEIREELVRRGFEVGVHGLHHNARLYDSKEEFLRQAVQINRVLDQWNAVGFRSPCMFHNLEWLKNLDIEYDCSTFDIDPFEPQPDAMHTFFPFKVNNEDSSTAYIELPYTLPQDFTLLILMRNRTIDIWKQKLKWIVNNGGMALMLTHPDYMCFKGKPAVDEYPVDRYREILLHVKNKYEGMYWHVLPREMARFWNAFDSTDSLSFLESRRHI